MGTYGNIGLYFEIYLYHFIPPTLGYSGESLAKTWRFATRMVVHQPPATGW